MSRVTQSLQRLALTMALGLTVATVGFATPRGPVPHPAPMTAKVTSPLPGAAVAGSPVAVMVELAEPPAAVDYAVALADKSVSRDKALTNARAAARLKVAHLQPIHAQLAAKLSSAPFNGHVIYRLTKAMNAIAVRIDPAHMDAIRALPGVKHVRIMQNEIPLNATSVPFIGAPKAWDNTLGLGNLTGTGVKVGIIDTGLDYIHPMFGGSGLLADYQANDRVSIAPGQFPTAKVIGGTDLAGDAYTGANDPAPDPNPMDCNGHGSHVAGTVAGLGVTTSGTTYQGPYGTATPFSSLRIGPGVAPGASLFAIRVFGCGGSTNLVPQAYEVAMDPHGQGDFTDHLDIVNLSLGSPYGGLDDSSAAAAQNAALVGVMSAIAQGNDGDTYFIGGSPGSADYAVAVAASVDPGVAGAVLQVNAPPSVAGDYAAAAAGFGGSTPPPSGQTGNVVLVQSATGTPDQGCDANYTNAAAISGSIALISRGTCGFQAKVANAQAAGAIGAIVFNNVPGDPTLISMGSTAPTPVITIPSVFISFDDGTKIAAAAGVNATLGAASAADTLASFSSRGPRGGGALPIRLKPDIAAPGLSIPSTQSGITCDSAADGCISPDPSGFIPGGQVLVLSGTSMATPHIAGSLALFREAHPTWSIEELKASAMNGAIHDLTVGVNGSGLRYGLGRAGAGRVDIPTTLLNPVTAFNDDDPGLVTLSFDGTTINTLDAVKELRVVNHGSQAATFNLGFDTVTAAPGVTFDLANAAQSNLTVPANSAIQVPVKIHAVSSAMDHVPDPTIAPTQAAPAPLTSLGNVPRHFLTEAGSYLVFSQAGKTAMRVPVYSVALPSSAMSGSFPIATGGAGAGSSEIDLSGVGVCSGTVQGAICNGNFPVTEASLVTPVELQVVHALDPTIPPFANLQYAGVAYDAADGLLLFGVSTWGSWSSPADVSFNIYVDSQNSGTYDKIIFNSDPGNMSSALFGGSATGQDTFVSALFDTNSENVSVENFVNLLPANAADSRVYANNVMVLAVSVADLGLAGTSFNYRIETCPGFLPLCTPLANFRYDGADGPYTFDYANPGIDFGGNFLAFDLTGAALPLDFNLGNYINNRSLGALLLHTHNTGGTQAQAVPIAGSRYADVGVTAAVTPATGQKVGSLVTLTLTVNNAGPNASRAIVVSDFLPNGLVYVSDDSNGHYDPNLGLWTVGQLGVNASATIHIRAQVTGSGEIVNTAQIGSAKPLDPNPSNDVASITLNAPRSADLALSAAATASGNLVTFTVTLKNRGVDPSYNPRVNVLLGGASYGTDVTVSQGSFDRASGVWQLGSVANGATETLKFTVRGRHSGGQVEIGATAVATTPDPILSNNRATASVTVH